MFSIPPPPGAKVFAAVPDSGKMLSTPAPPPEAAPCLGCEEFHPSVNCDILIDRTNEICYRAYRQMLQEEGCPLHKFSSLRGTAR